MSIAAILFTAVVAGFVGFVAGMFATHLHYMIDEAKAKPPERIDQRFDPVEQPFARLMQIQQRAAQTRERLDAMAFECQEILGYAHDEDHGSYEAETCRSIVEHNVPVRIVLQKLDY